MSAENCPFTLKGSDTSIDKIRKKRYVSFLVPLDPDDPDGLKSKEGIKELSNTETEEVLTFLLMFDEKVEDLDIPEGNARFRLFERLLSEKVKREQRTIRLDFAGQGTGKDIFDQCVSDFTVRFMCEEVAFDTKE